ncbi:thiazole synthase [bacterium]|nr:thiazole synthase [bacterium]|tara:strand:+ start:4228 stop:4998 length:771 start_codon:yes stop_codon:yes gene_type:complete
MLNIGPYEFHSRLVLGTGKYENFEIMKKSLEASGTDLVTVAIRRIDLNAPKGEGLLDFVDSEKFSLLPNTAGCFNIEDAILTAKLAREALKTNLIKLEVIGDKFSLWPDMEQTIEAARILIEDGFVVMPYCGPDPVGARKLQEIGCHAVMPLASPIGSGLGIQDKETLSIVRKAINNVPMIVDAGVGTASDAAVAMELGADGVLMNTAIAEAKKPIQMAEAMKYSIIAGKLAFDAGRMPRKFAADPSSPTEGVPGS